MSQSIKQLIFCILLALVQAMPMARVLSFAYALLILYISLANLAFVFFGLTLKAHCGAFRANSVPD